MRKCDVLATLRRVVCKEVLVTWQHFEGGVEEDVEGEECCAQCLQTQVRCCRGVDEG